MIVGIDYGSKLAGTTAIASLNESLTIQTTQSKKGQDADEFIDSFIRSQDKNLSIFMDAPLSLPGVFRGLTGYTDYFYRKCDREVKAMSPMFLGGLTARAMQLKENHASDKISFFESYPKLMAKELGLLELGYKKEARHIQTILTRIEYQTHFALNTSTKSWHEVNAVLALLIGVKHEQGKGEVYGDFEEGQIHG